MAPDRPVAAVPLDRIEIPDVREDATAADGDEARPEPPIEPGDPSPENALFVLLGVLVALAVVARLFVLFA